MANFVCINKCQWKGRVWDEGERMSYPDEHAKDVPHHFQREGVLAEQPVAEEKAPETPKGADKGNGYDQRVVAYLVTTTKRRNKLLTELNLAVPSTASREEIAMLIIDACAAKGVDPLTPEMREKLASQAVQPQRVEEDAVGAAPERMAETGEVSIASTL